MKEVERLTEENKFDITISDSKEESILKAIELLQQETPKAPITRPDISTKRVIIAFIAWLVFLSAATYGFIMLGAHLNLPLWLNVLLIVAIYVITVIFKARSFIINSVLLYQKHAPEKIRRACLFTPSCSEYMLLAINKYGVIKGLIKGIDRLSRCHHPNGGTDYP